MTVMVAIIITIMLATIITIMLNDNKDWKSNNSNSNNDIFMISWSLMITLHFSPEKKRKLVKCKTSQPTVKFS